MYSKWWNSFISHIDGSLTGTTYQDQSWPGSNSTEEVLYIPQNSRTGASLSDEG